MQNSVKIAPKTRGLVHHLYSTNISAKTSVASVMKYCGLAAKFTASFTNVGGKVKPDAAAAMSEVVMPVILRYSEGSASLVIRCQIRRDYAQDDTRPYYVSRLQRPADPAVLADAPEVDGD